MKKNNETLQKYKKLIDEAIEELKTPGKRHRQIPNILTVLRLFAPILIIPSAISGNIPLTVSLAAAFGLTDLADGFIARHWKLTSELGKNLDALADKLFSGTLLIAASIANPLLLMNVGLEMAIAGVNIYHVAKGNKTESTYMGKAKTWALFILAGLGIALPNASPNLINGLSILTAAMQGMTISSYLKPSTKQSSGNSPQPKKEVYEKPTIDVHSIDETIELIKTKELEDARPSQEELLEQLKEYREFLQEEQKNQQVVNQETIPVQMQKK